MSVEPRTNQRQIIGRARKNKLRSDTDSSDNTSLPDFYFLHSPLLHQLLSDPTRPTHSTALIGYALETRRCSRPQPGHAPAQHTRVACHAPILVCIWANLFPSVPCCIISYLLLLSRPLSPRHLPFHRARNVLSDQIHVLGSSPAVPNSIRRNC